MNAMYLTLIIIIILLIIIISLTILLLLLIKTKKYKEEEITKLLDYNRVTKAPTINKLAQESVSFLSENKKYTSVMFDIQNFKTLNAMLGYDACSKILKDIAQALNDFSHTRNMIYAHISKDEFFCTIEDERQSFLKIDEAFQSFLNRRISNNKKLILFQVGIFYHTNNTSIQDILQKTNYAHKLGKKNNHTYSYYKDEIKERAIYEKSIESKMLDGITNEEFKVCLQPQVNIKTNELVGVEVLTRWQTGEDFVLPDDFISIFEANGFIWKTDFYMFERTLKFAKRLKDEKKKNIKISVNFSRYSFTQKDFYENVVALTEKYGINKSSIVIEITESLAFESDEVAFEVIKKLKQIGFLIAVDDFGSGFSSIALFKHLDVDFVKLDKEFLEKDIFSEKLKIILEAIITTCKKMNIKVIAEGVENEFTANILKALDYDIAQGYYYSKPLFIDDFMKKYSNQL